MINEKESIPYTNESEIETRDNFVCLRILKYVGITIISSIAIVLAIIFICQIWYDKTLQKETFTFLINRIEAVVGFFIGLIIKNNKK